MHTEPTGLESLAGVIVFIIALVSVLGLGGLAAMMAIGAIVNRRQLITSWPANEEHAFQPYEQAGSSANSTAWAVSLAVGAVAAVFAIGVYFGVQPEIRDMTKDMNMSNLSKKTHIEAPAPTPSPAPAAPAPAAPAPAAPSP
ncbi:MAG TPA: hypothetical protein VGF94_25645 [Kofleriaceae bacterium]|jgi:hypothetical protein